MYKGDERIRGAGEQIEYTKELINEYIKCKQDIIYFCNKYTTIETLDFGKQLFNTFDYQKKILKALVEPPEPDRPHAIIMLPRQMGKTTLTTAYILHYAMFNANKNIFVIANKEKTSMEIMRKLQLAYREYPMWLQQDVLEWNKSSIVLGNGTRITAATTSPDSISGQAVNLLYIDEFAKVPAHLAEEFITSTYPVISSGKTAKIIISSTPVGMNHFYEFWTKAIKKQSNFYPIKVGWWENPNRDKAWKERMIRDIGKTRFAQEFSCKFLGSQDTLIDSDILEQMMPSEPVDLKYGSLMCIYEKPIVGEFYVLGVDPATGVGADYSVIQVLRIIDGESIEQVATYRYNKISLTNFTEIVISVSDYYNNAKMIIENNLGGESVCEAIWYTYENENLVHFENDKLGIRATTKTKFAAVMNMKRYIENGWVVLRDKDTIDELSRYIEVKKGQFSAGGSKQHDDLVAGLYWALYFVLSDEYADEFGEEDDGKPKKINDKYKLNRDGEYECDEEEDDTPTQFFFSD